jgi:hypothetical protein
MGAERVLATGFVRLALPEQMGRTRIGERTISSGENPKLEKHPGMLRMRNASPGTAVAFETCRKDSGGPTMASRKLDQLKGRVIGIGAARVSADDAQIALIEEYLWRNGSCAGSDRRCEAEAAG